MRDMDNKNILQSIERTFGLLDLLAEKSSGLGVSEIASSLELKTTTTHRILQTLIKIGIVQQIEENRHYMLAPKILKYGKAVIDQYDFIKSAHPYLGELSKAAGETAFMGILDDSQLVYMDHVDSQDQALRLVSQVGRRQPAYCTAMGKVLLAFQPPTVIDEFISTVKLEAYTANTLTTEKDIRNELQIIRKRGAAYDIEETEIGIRCVAAPIFSNNENIIAAISVSGPATRMIMKDMDTTLKELVITIAGKISKTIVNIG